ncbi:hypothetical protein WJX75_009544 [Coccomyxa subellipsoidea]|uniref:Uncharacterized protein n=1 Tax=Coccomyxa subellipsoidea TaxID=248742 RepID=A0ABR2YSK4_9CHLO
MQSLGQFCQADTWRRQEEKHRGDQWDVQGCRCSGEVYQTRQEEQRHTTSRGEEHPRAKNLIEPADFDGIIALVKR